MYPRGLVDYTKPVVAAATLLAVGFIIATLFGGYTAYKIKTAANTIEVTGSAKEAVMSDFARWVISLDTKTGVENQQVGFDRLERGTNNILAHLKAQGFMDIETPTPIVSPDYVYQQNVPPYISGYTVSRQIIIKSADIDAISALAGNITPLTGASYNVTTNGLELTYQKLADKRVELLSGAIRDAKARAEVIAKETGRSVGALRSATGGVVQVLPQGGIDISDYGSYDTQSRQKDIMVTVRATFILK